VPVIADVSTMAGTRMLAGAVLAAAPQLDLLINNVGVMRSDLTLTADRIETTFAVNHLSIFALTALLAKRLAASDSARIITIASEIHRHGTIAFDDPSLTDDYSVNKALAQSKLANILFTRALTKRLEGTGALAFSVHPGHVKTAFTRDLRGWFGLFVKLISVRFVSPDDGARTGVYLATTSGLEDQAGGYFKECAVAQPSEFALSDQNAERLWELSEQMTGIQFPALQREPAQSLCT
ncbi:MAG: SDR family NAD(P)-dependent oxidoreductase, partial [Blastomonas sp.]|nr:SDR family NAD(P)-dependent oxidoreductase [Blastomonas sp.]